MGKGDKKTKKGKIWHGSYGNSRPKNEKKKNEGEKKGQSEKKAEA
ncbi:MAG: 30S ribosomal protein THX [Phaeodactylibacter sp.]|nr:30S ribosomal protein THX [Phaeodactylibacter sp.]